MAECEQAGFDQVGFEQAGVEQVGFEVGGRSLPKGTRFSATVLQDRCV